jgi:hypothetical protein
MFVRCYLFQLFDLAQIARRLTDCNLFYNLVMPPAASRRPGLVEEQAACFVVRDHN